MSPFLKIDDRYSMRTVMSPEKKTFITAPRNIAQPSIADKTA